MTRVQAIEEEIKNLSPTELAELRDWLLEHDEIIAEIRPISRERALRPIGLAKGEFVVPDDFDAPLPDDVLEQFEGK